MALADEFDGFLVDLDGVVWVGRELVPGAARRCGRCSTAGKEIVFVTNNPARPPSTYVERLREAGVPVEDGRVVTAGVATAGLAAERVGAGGERLRDRRAGLQGDRAEAGLEPARGRGGARGRRRARLRPPRLRLRGAADRDPGAAGRRSAVRDQPRPDPADAGRRLARNRLDPRRGRDRLGRAGRDRRQARAPPLRPGARR